MTINTQITDGNSGIDTVVDIEKDCISICFPGSNVCINICISNSKVKAYVYPEETRDSDIITLTTL